MSYYSPRFIWLLRDVNQSDLTVGGHCVDSQSYFESVLKEVGNDSHAHANISVRQQIINYFKERECVDVPYPFAENNGNNVQRNFNNDLSIKSTVEQFNRKIYKIRERV